MGFSFYFDRKLNFVFLFLGRNTVPSYWESSFTGFARFTYLLWWGIYRFIRIAIFTSESISQCFPEMIKTENLKVIAKVNEGSNFPSVAQVFIFSFIYPCFVNQWTPKENLNQNDAYRKLYRFAYKHIYNVPYSPHSCLTNVSFYIYIWIFTNIKGKFLFMKSGIGLFLDLPTIFWAEIDYRP